MSPGQHHSFPDAAGQRRMILMGVSESGAGICPGSITTAFRVNQHIHLESRSKSSQRMGSLLQRIQVPPEKACPARNARFKGYRRYRPGAVNLVQRSEAARYRHRQRTGLA